MTQEIKTALDRLYEMDIDPYQLMTDKELLLKIFQYMEHKIKNLIYEENKQ
jgi:hypothetical protein